MSAAPTRQRSGSVVIAAGIFASRIAGLVRETVLSRVLGLGAAADAFGVALKIPNTVQNLLGEGSLSTSFIPVYSGLLDDEDDPEEAAEVAGAVAAALMFIVGVSVLILVVFARPIVGVVAYGIQGERFDLIVTLTQIMAVGVGFVVLSAWCLGILNSHRSFFLPYVAPVVWNMAQIMVLLVVWALAWEPNDVAVALAFGVTVGGLLQLLVQLPTALRLAGRIRLRYRRDNVHVRDIQRRFVPAILGRGVIQLSALVDVFLAGFLAAGAPAALTKAQILYTLPVSIFAISIANAELPELSRIVGKPGEIANRTSIALRRVAFWMLLAALMYVAAGDLIVKTLFEGGLFNANNTTLVWFVIGAYALGLPAIGASRMLQNTSYALGDTRGPAKIAALRVVASTAVGVAVMFSFDRVIIDGGLQNLSQIFVPAGPLVEREVSTVHMGAVGLALGSAVGSWVELTLLTRHLRRLLPEMPNPFASAFAPAKAGALAFVVVAALKLVGGALPSLIETVLICGIGGFVYTVTAFRNDIRESEMVLRPIRRVIWRNNR